MRANAYFKCHGYTYLGLLFIVVLLGINLTMASTLYSFAQQREKERQLMFVGAQFRHAITVYYQRTPGTIKQYPKTLQDLIQDNRFVGVQRYLRKIYIDPITKSQDWGLVKSPDGGVMGIYSKSTASPLKNANFDSELLNLGDYMTYQDWQFVYLPAEMDMDKPSGFRR